MDALTTLDDNDANRDNTHAKKIAWAIAEEVGDHMSRMNRASSYITTVCMSQHCMYKIQIASEQAISQTQVNLKEPMMKGQTDLDSHADTCCAGATAIVIETTGKTCDVSPFSSSYDALTNVPIVKAVTAYDDPFNGESCILVMNQALYFGDTMESSLLCPNQLRSHGVIVDDIPIHLAINGNSTHSLYFPTEDMRLPLEMHG